MSLCTRFVAESVKRLKAEGPRFSRELSKVRGVLHFWQNMLHLKLSFKL